MCPACIGSALLVLGGAGSTGGLALIASRIIGRKQSDAAASGEEQAGDQEVVIDSATRKELESGRADVPRGPRAP